MRVAARPVPAQMRYSEAGQQDSRHQQGRHASHPEPSSVLKIGKELQERGDAGRVRSPGAAQKAGAAAMDIQQAEPGEHRIGNNPEPGPAPSPDRLPS